MLISAFLDTVFVPSFRSIESFEYGFFTLTAFFTLCRPFLYNKYPLAFIAVNAITRSPRIYIFSLYWLFLTAFEGSVRLIFEFRKKIPAGWRSFVQIFPGMNAIYIIRLNNVGKRCKFNAWSREKGTSRCSTCSKAQLTATITVILRTVLIFASCFRQLEIMKSQFPFHFSSLIISRCRHRNEAIRKSNAQGNFTWGYNLILQFSRPYGRFKMYMKFLTTPAILLIIFQAFRPVERLIRTD